MLRWKDKKLEGADARKIVRNSGVYAILLLALVAMTFFGVCTPKGQMQFAGITGAVGKVASERIYSLEFRRAYSNMLQRFQAQFKGQLDPATLGLAKMVIGQLIDERVSYLSALEAGVEAQPADVEKFLIEVKAFRDEKGQFSPEAFRQYLRSQGHSEMTFTEEFRRNLTVQKFKQTLPRLVYVSSTAAALDKKLEETKVDVEYIKVDPAKLNVAVAAAEIDAFLNDAGKARVKQYYEANPKEFKQDEQVKARHILVGFKGSRNATPAAEKRTKEQALAQAQELLKQVRKSGADFVKIAKASTDEPSGKERGGDLGFFDRKTMDPKFTEAAFALKPEAISDVVETPFGYHIIKVEARREKVERSLADSEREIAQKILRKELAPKRAESIAAEMISYLKDKKDITPLLKSHQLEKKSTGPTGLNSRYFEGIGSSETAVQSILALKEPGAVSASPVSLNDSFFVLSLKSRALVKSEGNTKEAADPVERAGEALGANLFSALEKQTKKKLQDDGKIWESPELSKIDQRSPTAAAAEEG